LEEASAVLRGPAGTNLPIAASKQPALGIRRPALGFMGRPRPFRVVVVELSPTSMYLADSSSVQAEGEAV
jgi:hypothetical protein